MEPASGPSVSRPTRSARPFSPRCGRLWRPRASARLTRTRSRKRESRGVLPWGFDASVSALLSSIMRTIPMRVLAASRALQRRLKADHPEGVPEPVFWSTISMGQTASKDFKTSCMPLWCSELAQQ